MSNIKINKSDIAWAYVGNFFRVAANIILLPLVLKFLSDDELGIWYVFGSISQIVVILDFGFAATLSRNISYTWCGVDSLQKENISENINNKETNFEYLKLVLQTCKIIYSVIALIALLFLLTAGLYYINSLDSSCIIAWIIYSIGVALNMKYCYFTSFLLGVGAIAENNKAAIACKVTQIILSFILLFLGYGLLGISIAYLLSGIVIRICSKFYFDRYENIGTKLRQVQSKVPWSDIKHTFKIIWHNASKDGLVTLANYLNTQANTLICSSVLGLATTGSYGLSVQLTSVVATIAGIPFSSALPKLQEKAVTNDKEGGQSLFSGTMVLFVISYVILIGAVVAMLPVIKWLKPTLMINVSMFLAIAILGFMNQIYHYNASLISTFNVLPYPKAFIISSIISVVGSYFLARYSSMGVWSLIVSPIVVTIIYNLWKWPSYVLNIYETNLWAFCKEGCRYAVLYCSSILKKSNSHIVVND